ncbi:MAG: protein phosphatase 2C domain-containing protein [Ferruginibacter sp.]
MGENYFGITDPGRQRSNNEDSFIAKTVSNSQFIVACVIDGVGGYAGGEVAAQLTRDVIINDLDKLPGNIIDQLISTLENANERIIREKQVSPQNEKMACVVTLAVVDLEKNVFYFAHVGDTRLYLFRDGSLIKITRDHSTVGFLEESGRLSEEAAMQHPKRNEVNKALGYEAQIVLRKDFIDTGESPFLPGDTILACSDGLTDMIPAGEIISILKSAVDLPTKGKRLIHAANDAGGRDNITVVLVNNDKSPVQLEVTKPMFPPRKINHSSEEELKITGQDTNHNSKVIKSNKGKNINRLLLYLCVIFLSGFIWLLVKNYKKNKNTQKPIETINPRQRNGQELNFLNSINASSSAIVKLSGSQPIIITDTIFIKNDSLHIIGNGNSFVRDTAFTGPAFLLTASCRYVLLDSLIIENFNVGVLVLNKGLHLKNVWFKNCVVPVQFQEQLSQNKPVSGAQAEVLFNYGDSLKGK